MIDAGTIFLVIWLSYFFGYFTARYYIWSNKTNSLIKIYKVEHEQGKQMINAKDE